MKQILPGQPSPSWQLVPRSARLVSQYIEQTLFLFLLPALLLLLGQLLIGDIKQLHHVSDFGQREQLGLLCFAVGGIWSLLNIGPALYFRVHTVAGEAVSLGQSYRQGLGYFWPLIGYYLALAAVFIVGFVAFIIPGIVLLVLYVNRYYLAQYYIVGQNLGVKAALASSRADTEPFRGAIWGIVGVQFVGSLVVGALGVLGIIGTLAAEVINASLFFLAALRYQEIRTLSAASTATHVGKK